MPISCNPARPNPQPVQTYEPTGGRDRLKFRSEPRRLPGRMWARATDRPEEGFAMPVDFSRAEEERVPVARLARPKPLVVTASDPEEAGEPFLTLEAVKGWAS